MSETGTIFVGQGEWAQHLLCSRANRHGLIAGATGTGKTISLQILAEGFSALGVPVFLADVKGDLAGMSQPGEPKPKLLERAEKIGLTEYSFSGFPVVFWDLLGEQGHPIRTTISDMGPLLLSRLMALNDVQEGVLTLAFRVADDNGLLLLDLKDLRAMLAFVAENADALRVEYGNVSSASIGAIQRNLLTLEEQKGELFFGEPALDLADLMRTDDAGRGIINILAADKIMQSPALYATFLLWLLAELFERLPEVGDLDKPRLVFFFDEAHLLFDDAPPALVDKVEQVVRLIRSKGVGVYFITQNPIDIPDSVLGQLGNRIQHALRAFTPRDQKAVNTAAETFRPNPKLDVAQVITQLGVGEALVSLLDETGAPGIVDKTLIRPPSSKIGPIEPGVRAQLIAMSLLRGRYDQMVDRESAYERLKARADQGQPAPVGMSERQTPEVRMPPPREEPRRAARRSDSIVEAVGKSMARGMASSLGRELVRGVLGSLLGGSGRRRKLW